MIQIIGGSDYAAALIPVALMALYPIHQSYGQLLGSVYHAMDKTKLYRNIQLIQLIFGGIMGFYLVATKTYGGLELGASGLAVKIVVMQIIGINILLFFILRELKLKIMKYIFHQIGVVVVFGMLGIGVSNGVFLLGLEMKWHMLINVAVYGVATVTIALKAPIIFGLNKMHVQEFIQTLVRVIQRK